MISKKKKKISLLATRCKSNELTKRLCEHYNWGKKIQKQKLSHSAVLCFKLAEVQLKYHSDYFLQVRKIK